MHVRAHKLRICLVIHVMHTHAHIYKDNVHLESQSIQSVHLYPESCSQTSYANITPSTLVPCLNHPEHQFLHQQVESAPSSVPQPG